MAGIQIGSHLFSAEQLQAAIAETAKLGPDKKGAFVASVDATGAHAQLTMRISDHIEIEGAATWTPGTNDVAAGAKLIASW